MKQGGLILLVKYFHNKNLIPDEIVIVTVPQKNCLAH